MNSWCRSELETKLNDLRLEKLRLQEQRYKLQSLQSAHQLRSKRPLFRALGAEYETIGYDLIDIEREIDQIEETLRQKRYSKVPT